MFLIWGPFQWPASHQLSFLWSKCHFTLQFSVGQCSSSVSIQFHSNQIHMSQDNWIHLKSPLFRYNYNHYSCWCHRTSWYLLNPWCGLGGHWIWSKAIAASAHWDGPGASPDTSKASLMATRPWTPLLSTVLMPLSPAPDPTKFLLGQCSSELQKSIFLHLT